MAKRAQDEETGRSTLDDLKARLWKAEEMNQRVVAEAEEQRGLQDKWRRELHNQENEMRQVVYNHSLAMNEGEARQTELSKRVVKMKEELDRQQEA